MKNKAPIFFITLALLALLLGILFGLLSALQYLFPDFLKEIIPFTKMRPFHTTTVISWIILAATGSIYFFISQVEKIAFVYPKLPKVHFIIYLLTGIAIYLSFIFDKTEGREYLSYAPILTLPILLGWLLFGLNYFKTIKKNVTHWPVYYWMWGTGIVFMMYHLCEAHLWTIPSFRAYFIKDLTVQWKSYGSFVGSWNMLVYGTAIYLMSKIKNDVNVARGKTKFFFYFLGLTNLMLGWAHHTYIIPTQEWIRFLAYGVSMTEWIIFFHMIYSWKKSLSKQEKEDFCMTYKFLLAADFWVFLNIILALLFSIPAINFFTHGTHITVAHSMGTTIGINTTILLASLFFVVSKIKNHAIPFTKLKKTFYAYNGFLILFLAILIYAGAVRSNWMYFSQNIPFSEMQSALHNTYIGFFVFGLGLVVTLLIFAFKLLKPLLNYLKK